MKKYNWLIFVIGALPLALGCGRTSDKPPIEVVQDMMNSPAIKAQGALADDPDASGMLVPPEGTIPRDHKPYLYTSPAQAEQGLSNPMANDFRPEIIDKGRIHYERYCLVCHGVKGDGKGPVHVPFNGLIKTLVTGPVLDFSDERLFHVITVGQGIMGAYQSQIPEEELRWAVVNYIRSLQKQAE